MINLVIKDIVIQKKTFLFSLFYTIVAATGFFTFNNNGFILYDLSPMVIIYMFITYAASYDDKNKSELVLNSLPVKREQIVISKYISAFVFAAIGFIYSISIGFIGNATGLLDIRSISLFDVVSVLAFVCIYSSIYFAMYFKLGAVKTNQIIFVIVIILFSLPLLVFANGNDNVLTKMYYFIITTTSLPINSLALMIGIILFLISLVISIRLYNNKQF